MTVETLQVPVYRPFAVQVARLQRLSPSFLRVTFTGADLDECAPNGWDQRIKVLLPIDGRGHGDCPTGADWYGEWRALPEERRNPIRTYTVRASRPDLREMDVDFVLHGATGPASAWAERAAVGDEVALSRPNARFPGPTGGFEWHPPADASCLLVAGDETAVPAICAIVESLPAGQPARVLLEVPDGRRRPPPGAPRPGSRSPGCRGGPPTRPCPRPAASCSPPPSSRAVQDLTAAAHPGTRGGPGRRRRRRRDPVGGAGGGRSPTASGPVRLARRRGRDGQGPAPPPGAGGRARPERRSRSWATGGTGRPATDRPLRLTPCHRAVSHGAVTGARRRPGDRRPQRHRDGRVLRARRDPDRPRRRRGGPRPAAQRPRGGRRRPTARRHGREEITSPVAPPPAD